MKDEDILMAYFSGVMDGDGSFSLVKKSNGERSPLYQPNIQLGNVRMDLVKRFKEYFGGTITTRAAYIGDEGSYRKEFYTWKADKALKCENVLSKLIPNLVIKKERAKYLLDYIRRNPFIRGSKRLSEEILENRQKAYIKMLNYNRELWLHEDKVIKSSQSMRREAKFWAYVAGLMDTDGSFSISQTGSNPVIQLAMTDMRGINYIRSHIPLGSFNFYKSKSCRSGACYRFSLIKRDESIFFLKKIIPFMTVKNEVASVLLEYCQTFNPWKKKRKRLPIEEKEKRMHYREIIKHANANKHGVLKPSLIDLEVQKLDDRAEPERDRDRLSERDSKEYATVRSEL